MAQAWLAPPRIAPRGPSNGLLCDQIVRLAWRASAKKYPDRLRRIRYTDPKTAKTLVFLTNNFTLPAIVVADLYRCRWQIELFFKWIKQNLRIKSFFGLSENAVKTQIWIAVAVYVLIAIIKKRLALTASLYTILQLLSVTVFEKIQLDQLLAQSNPASSQGTLDNQLNLFDD